MRRVAFPLLLLVLPLVSRAAPDLVIRGGRVIDGTGSPAVAADVAVQGGRIVAVGNCPEAGKVEIDAKGLVVAPGFIDVHTHSEDILELPLAGPAPRLALRVEVDHSGEHTEACGRYAKMHGERGFPRASLLADDRNCLHVYMSS